MRCIAPIPRAFNLCALAYLCAFVWIGLGIACPALAATNPEKRIAFVVGNESYAAGALPTASNDAGLVAQTLQAAGFEVVGARDLDAETLRQSYADFLRKVGDAGPDTIAFVYLAGYGLQYGNDNYYVPIGANVSRDTDIPIQAVRFSDLSGPLVAMNLKARFMVFDAAYKPPFKLDGAPLAGGFSLVDASPGLLVAYNSAPGTVAPVAKGNYGLYAQSLAAMLREGGLAPDVLFDRVRLRVNDQSKGAEVPWDSSKIDTAFRFFVANKDAPAPKASAAEVAALLDKPLKDLPAREAYTAAVARDSVDSYQAFSTAFPNDPQAKRARVLLAARREAVTWRRTISVDSPDAYWSYLSRYPRGPHADDARLRLRELSVALAPPQTYQAIAYDIPPPPPDEVVYVERPVIYFDDPGYDFPPPPPPPDYWLPPVPVAFLDLPPPPPPVGLFFLPVPAFVPLPAYYDPPAYVAYPAGNFFYGGFGGDPGRGNVFINNTTVINNIHQTFPGGGPVGGSAGGNALRNAAIGAAVVALPAAALAHAATLQRQGITTPAQLNAIRPGGPGAPGGAKALPAGQRLPGAANGRPLPLAANATPNGVPPGRPNVAVRPATPAPAATPNRAAADRAAAQQRQNAIQQQRQDAVRQRQVERAQGQQQRVEQRQQRVQQQRAQQQQVQKQRVQQQQRVPQQVRQPQPQIQRAPPPQPQRAAPPPQRAQAPQQARGGGGGGGGRPPPARPAPKAPVR